MGEVPVQVTPVSPKVAAAGLAGSVAAVIVGVAALFGLSVDGELAGAAGVLLGAVVSVVAAWAKRDPLRDAGQAASGG